MSTGTLFKGKHLNVAGNIDKVTDILVFDKPHKHDKRQCFFSRFFPVALHLPKHRIFLIRMKFQNRFFYKQVSCTSL